jgi:hypothetical protein
MNPEMLVQSLKGSKAQVLWAFFFARMAMDVNDVIRWTSLKRETCYQALNALEAVNLLGTQTLSHGRKVWLLGSEMLPALRDLYEIGTGSPLLQESEKRTPGALNVVVDEISESVSTITTLTTTIGQESEKRTPGNLALIAALNRHNITGKKRRELLSIEDLTAEEIDAQVEYARNEPANWDNPVGQAINRIIDRIPVPETDGNGHSKSCKCAVCQIHKFTGGKYSNRINQFPDDEQELEETCLWQDKGRPFCGKPVKPGSDRWCEEHYQVGVETFGTGEIYEDAQ